MSWTADVANEPDYRADIPLDVATRAHSGTSFTPEKRGGQERADYAQTLRRDLENLTALADTEEKKTALVGEFARYRDGLKARWLAELAASSRCVSTMIAGPSNFNVRQAQKRGDSADRRRTELLEFRERALNAIRKILQPELRPIMSGDADALDRLREKITAAEAHQAKMKATNAAIRKAVRGGESAQVAALVALGYSQALAAELLKGDAFGNIGFPAYETTNNAANIRRMRERLIVLERAKAIPAKDTQGTAARIEDRPEENRVRLYFPGKPSEEIRTRLKRAGFRWTPTLGAWGAYRNSNSLSVAAEVAGITVQKENLDNTDATV